MSNTLEPDALEQLRTIAASIADLRSALKRMEYLRDSMARTLRPTGVSVIALAEAADVTRSRLYQILEAPNERAPDDQLAWFAAMFEDAYLSAVDEWEYRGHVGSPEDYFPIERLLSKA